MGMFDYVHWKGRLPVTRDARVRQRINPAQSKSVRLWENADWAERAHNGGCVTLTVTEDGRMLDPDGRAMDWSGELVFYGERREDEFTARFVGGRLKDCVHTPG